MISPGGQTSGAAAGGWLAGTDWPVDPDCAPGPAGASAAPAPAGASAARTHAAAQSDAAKTQTPIRDPLHFIETFLQ